MITLNYKYILKDFLQGGDHKSVFGAYPIKTPDNVTLYTTAAIPSINTYFYKYDKVATGKDYGGVIIGSGNTPATEEDYWLESQINSGFDSRVVCQRSMDNNGNSLITFLVIVVNASQANITINEIGFGMFCGASRVQGATNASSNTSAVFLIDRTVLSSPYVITPGNGVTMNYMLKTVDIYGEPILTPASGLSF